MTITDRQRQVLDDALAVSGLSGTGRDYAEKLLSKHGFDWLAELANCENRLGPGVSKGVEFSINEFEVDEDGPEEELEDCRTSPQEALETFIGEAEFEWEQGLEDIDECDGYPFYYALKHWIDLRVDYHRSVEGMKANHARGKAYEESQKVDLGGDELFCNVCGEVFFDNLKRLQAAERSYCSIDCQIGLETDCITCGKHVVIQRPKRGFRNYFNLNSFCDFDCAREESRQVSKDNQYVRGIKERLAPTGAEVDETITRRAVFDKYQGRCYLCGKATNWTRNGDWDPLLANVDHIHPVSKGGSHTWENVALACQLCNTRKSDRVH